MRGEVPRKQVRQVAIAGYAAQHQLTVMFTSPTQPEPTAWLAVPAEQPRIVHALDHAAPARHGQAAPDGADGDGIRGQDRERAVTPGGLGLLAGRLLPGIPQDPTYPHSTGIGVA